MSASSATVGERPSRVGGIDCRVWARFACDVQASCQPVAARNDRDVQWPATLCDLSVKGLGLVLGRRFERGAALAIELPATDTRPADTLLVRVVRVQALGDGRWLMGCSLISELSEDELEGILNLGQTTEPVLPPPGQYVIAGVVFRWVEDKTRLRTVPARRLFLKGRWPLMTGTVLRIQPGDAPAGTGWLRLQVQDCRRRAGKWMVSCTLVGRAAAGNRETFDRHFSPTVIVPDSAADLAGQGLLEGS